MDTQEGMFEHLGYPYSQANELQADNLQGSGFETVLMTSLYAIVGAVALERGGEVANKVVQEKILAPLGFSFSPDS
jgi:large subunit ribosomal protein L15